MPNFTYAVADCNSDERLREFGHPSMNNVQGWARFPLPKKEPERLKIYEERCRRKAGWRATRNMAICSLHFIAWGANRPLQEHPNPELLAYNG